MKKLSGLIRGSALALLLTLAVAGIGYGAAGGSQTVTVAVGAAINITVPAAASIAWAAPPNCGTTSSSVNVKSNRPWNLQVRSEPATYPNGKAKDGLGAEMVNAFQYKGGDIASFTNITSSYANLFTANQGRTGNRDVAVDYQQCVDYLDAPGTYTVVVEFLGVQP